MTIRRIVPNIGTSQPEQCRDFYSGLLGLQVAMDMGWIATYVSPTNPTAQLSVISSTGPDAAQPSSFSISVEVEDVDRIHADAVARGYRIVYPLTDEPWGVRRFGVEDPNGLFINVMCHRAPSSQIAE